MTLVGMVTVKPEVLTMEEANEQRLKKEEQCICFQKAVAKEPRVPRGGHPTKNNKPSELRKFYIRLGSTIAFN